MSGFQRLIGPFKCQNDAFNAIDIRGQLGEYMMCWAQEVGCNGARVYYAGNYKAFWNKYSRLDRKYRCFYEVIKEGLYVKLYFDIEFEIEYNKDKNGDEMMRVCVYFLV